MTIIFVWGTRLLESIIIFQLAFLNFTHAHLILFGFFFLYIATSL